MKLNLMQSLCLAVIGAAKFLEFSGDEIVDPDSAVEALEAIAAVLQCASSEERAAFLKTCQLEAQKLRAANELSAADFVGGLPAALGLEDEA